MPNQSLIYPFIGLTKIAENETFLKGNVSRCRKLARD